MDELKPCPFCMETNMLISENRGEIKCSCGAMMCFGSTSDRFSHVVADIYRFIPGEKGIDIAARHWNRRAGEDG